jgi:eukaryotic translation initiation factor 2C
MKLEHTTMEFQSQEMHPFVRSFLKNSAISVAIVPSSAAQMDISDFRASVAHETGSQSDRSPLQFLELLITQPLINTKTYDVVSAGKVFETSKQEEFFNGLVIRTGIAKGTRMISNDGNPIPALVADVKKCAFFKEQPLSQAFEKCRGDTKTFMSLYKGIRCCLSYAPYRTVVIEDLTTTNVGQLSINQRDGTTISVAAYYAEKYDVQRVNLNRPAVRIEMKPDAAFPMEVLTVLPNQRITIEKMSADVSRKLLELNTVVAQQRYDNLTKQLANVFTPENKQFYASFGVKVHLDRNNVEVGVRRPPELQFGDRKIVAANGNWSKEAGRLRFVEPSTRLKNWAVAYDNRLGGPPNQFVEAFLRSARGRGMTVPQPIIVPVVQGNLDSAFKTASEKPLNFLLFIDDKSQKTHDLLKLLETKYSILTQHVAAKNAIECRPMTLGNIVNKFNMKVFGMNYKPIIEAAGKRIDLCSNILVIGMDVVHPPKASLHVRTRLRESKIDQDSFEPSIVGISGNYAGNPYNFVGDFFFQPTRREEIDGDILTAKTKWILEKYVASRQKTPGLIFIMRDGLSVGQYEMSIEKEIAAIRQGCTEYKATYHPKIVYIVTTKRHNKRFFLQANAGVANLEPGSVVDRKVVRADCPEFFMQSHIPLKGTAKLPQYNVLINEANLSNDELQAFNNALCHSHQIVNLSISRPEPVYQASELAKRGKNIYTEFLRTARDKLPTVEVEGQKLIDFAKLTTMLGYEKKMLSDTRFTA